MYEVYVSDKVIGYTENKETLENKIKENITEVSSDNIEKIELKELPKYELKFVSKAQKSNDNEIIIALQNDADVKLKEENTEIAKNNNTENANIESNIVENENAESINIESNGIENENTKSVELSNSTESEDKKTNLINLDDVASGKNIENASIVASGEVTNTNIASSEVVEIANVNGVKFMNVPITGTITSRYGESSSLRKSTHTGVDIAASTGTKIKAVADGTVIFASRNGSYGNLVKVDHGNGVQTWYAHTSKMLVSVGQTVKAGDVIALVGSTGNSTGPHLHFEIRINNQIVNPQNYIYFK